MIAIVASAFLRRDWRIETSYRAAMVAQVAMAVFGLALAFYVGQLVDRSEFEASQGLDTGYFGYAVVGLALFQILQAGLPGLATRIREEQTTGTFEALLATPSSPSLVILSSASYDLIRAVMATVGFIALAVVLFGLSLHTDADSLLVALLVLLMFVVLFLALSALVAGLTVIFKRAYAVVNFLLMGAGFLAGAYFPVDVLPEPLQSIGNAFPITWGLESFRAALLGGDIDAAQLTAFVAFCVALMPLTLLSFSVALRRARRDGTIAQY